MILVIDNYDSFTFNLVQYLGILGAKVEVRRNDAITVEDIQGLNPERILISPGPCTPNEAGISMDVIREYSGKLPLLGVCLGHQSIGQVFGGDIIRAAQIMHGKTSPMEHTSVGVFSDLPSPFRATRYHSLVVDKTTLPDCLQVTAWSDDGEIMGIRHREHPTQGVQFHPESILTEHGLDLMRNWLEDKS